jgi:hypothetical protein
VLTLLIGTNRPGSHTRKIAAGDAEVLERLRRQAFGFIEFVEKIKSVTLRNQKL